MKVKGIILTLCVLMVITNAACTTQSNHEAFYIDKNNYTVSKDDENVFVITKGEDYEEVYAIKAANSDLEKERIIVSRTIGEGNIIMVKMYLDGTLWNKSILDVEAKEAYGEGVLTEETLLDGETMSDELGERVFENDGITFTNMNYDMKELESGSVKTNVSKFQALGGDNFVEDNLLTSLDSGLLDFLHDEVSKQPK